MLETYFLTLSETCNSSVDIDECTNITYGIQDGCEHNCHNSIGSYHCTCDEGYTLQPDGKKCQGNYFSLQYKTFLMSTAANTLRYLMKEAAKHDCIPFSWYCNLQ